MLGTSERLLEKLLPLLLLAVSFPLWYAGMRLRGGTSLLDHHPVDQHSRQAKAWLEGRIDLEEPPGTLEIAQYKGRFFNSFPPTPTLVELPLVLIFGRRTPSSLAIFCFWYATLLMQVAALRRRGYSSRSALLTALAFLFGTNVYVSCSRASVWAYGQALGGSLGVMAVCQVMHNGRRGLAGPGPGYALLSLAVGCRPLLLFLAPLLLALDWRTNGTGLRRGLVRGAAWMAPFGLALLAYNWLRFDDPLEFGHNYLPWAQALPHGIFSLHHVRANAYHAFLRLPEWSASWPYMRFDTLGTAFWLHNGVLVVALVGLRRLDAPLRAAAAVSLLPILCGVLLYESAGNRQVGARYFIDLLPGAFAVFACAYSRFDRWALLASLASFALNIHGLIAWQGFLAAEAGP